MSYDVIIGDEWANYTSNMRAFFAEYVGEIRDFDGLPGRIVAYRIDSGLRKITAESASVLDTYNSPNGWGKWPTAVAWLMKLRDSGRRFPEATVEVSA